MDTTNLKTREDVINRVRNLSPELQDKFCWLLIQTTENFKYWKPDEYLTLSMWELCPSEVAQCVLATDAQYIMAFSLL